MADPAKELSSRPCLPFAVRRPMVQPPTRFSLRMYARAYKSTVRAPPSHPNLTTVEPPKNAGRRTGDVAEDPIIIDGEDPVLNVFRQVYLATSSASCITHEYFIKSTLIQTLFRIVEPTIGQIQIDGIDILSIVLHDLRSQLSIIPQDPTMFAGTVRNNLHPIEEYTDEQIWEALDKCQLNDEVQKKTEKLDSPLSENGENWSVGQRQLVYLGGVLLKKSKVLVLDEATTSVDTATDNLIQWTLKHHFTDSTVITIARRITSVLDSDMVLLLYNGLLKEYDTPERLLKDKSSSFASLVAEYNM